MAYISLYRKYRSQTFDDVIGQDHVVRTIKNAIKAGKISQAYLFCGSRGTGKTTVARLVAKALNCQSTPGPTPDFCNVCESCVTITEGSAVDVIELDAASNRSVDDIDALRDGVKYSPMHLRYKVYIIDEAHQLSSTAKDAFLKTLEEPPPHAVFILATTEEHRIPFTIRSRCQQFEFRRGTLPEIIGRLKFVIKSEKVKIDDDALDIIARTALGSYRDAISVLEQVMAYTEDRISTNDVYTVLGMVDEEVLLELGDVIIAGDVAAAFALADKLLWEGRDVRELLRSATGHFRDLLALKVGADTHKQDDPKWSAQARELSHDALVRLIDVFSAADKDLRWNEQHRLGLEMAILRAIEATARLGPQPSRAPTPAREPTPEPARAKVEPSEPPEPAAPVKAEKLPKARPAAQGPFDEIEAAPAEEKEPDAQEVPAQSSEGEVTLGDIQRQWRDVLLHIQKALHQPNVAARARGGGPMRLSGSTLEIGFPARFEFHRRGTQEDAAWVEQALAEVLGAELKVSAVAIDGEPDQPPEQPAAAPQQSPVLDDLLSTFGGTVVEDDKSPWEE